MRNGLLGLLGTTILLGTSCRNIQENNPRDSIETTISAPKVTYNRPSTTGECRAERRIFNHLLRIPGEARRSYSKSEAGEIIVQVYGEVQNGRVQIYSEGPAKDEITPDHKDAATRILIDPNLAKLWKIDEGENIIINYEDLPNNKKWGRSPRTYGGEFTDTVEIMTPREQREISNRFGQLAHTSAIDRRGRW
jgi:hypothetical protein